MHEREYLAIILTLFDLQCSKIAIIARGGRGFLPLKAYMTGRTNRVLQVLYVVPYNRRGRLRMKAEPLSGFRCITE